jgi:hypothetical protein
MRKQIALFLFVGCVVVLLVASAQAQTVVYRARIGNFVEAIAYVPNGPNANHIAISDGFEVWAFPAAGNGNAPARMLFNTHDLSVSGGAFRGMAYITSE